jgi:predicted polyphosphate/ATP-dependent NAD kinase
MSLVGIIANPASGKDIRRIVGNAITVDNQQKLNIVKRILVALAGSGVEQVWVMPEQFGFGKRALKDLATRPDVQQAVQVLDMPHDNLPEDTPKAAERMRQAGADCIIVLGGDGTCRLVAKTAGDVPLIPISSGTNNVVPDFIEGTVAGLAAAHLGRLPAEDRRNLCWQHKRLVVQVNGQEVDHALVDAAIVDTAYVGSRAVWDPHLIRQVFVTRAGPAHIGISSIIGMAKIIDPRVPLGAQVLTGQGQQTVRTTILPGELVDLTIGPIETMQPGTAYPVLDSRPVVLALDGERELVLYPGDQASIMLDTHGPWLVDVPAVLLHALQQEQYLTPLNA